MAMDLAPRADPRRIGFNYYWSQKRKELYNKQEQDLLNNISLKSYTYDYPRLSAVKFNYDYALVVKGDVERP